MTYYIDPIWFYLVGVSTGLKIFLGILGGFPLICIFMAWDTMKKVKDKWRDEYEIQSR